MFLKHQGLASGPCEKQAGHHAGRPSANDDQIECGLLRL
jgi:hypothetical protein